MNRRTLLAALVALALAATSCGGTAPDETEDADADTAGITAVAPADPTTVTSTPGTGPTPTSAPLPPTSAAPAPTVAPRPPTTTRPPSTTAPPAPGDPRITLVSAQDLGASWRPGCPVGPESLRRVTVTFVGFDGVEHEGALVVHADAAAAVLAAFDRMRVDHVPIRKVVPIDQYGGSDDASMADDNTSGFNCRRSTGSPTAWSQHAYGRAVDVNPIENPYVRGTMVAPPAGSAFLDRRDARPGMAVAGGPLVSAFAAVGWGWGGAWTTTKDYQHVSATGR